MTPIGTYECLFNRIHQDVIMNSRERNDVPLCLELANEFKECPCIEDVQDYRMITEFLDL